MNALVRKEIRLILPAWAAALVLAVAPVWFIPVNDLVGWQHQGTAMACYAFALGAILVGLAPYGQYFANLGEYVSPSTGMLTIKQTDLSVPGRGLSLDLARVYTEPGSFLNGNPFNYESSYGFWDDSFTTSIDLMKTGLLVVSQSKAVHEEIRRLLDQLRQFK